MILVAALPVSTHAGTRPVSEFLEAQGTFCIDDGGGGCLLFVPPVPNFIGWTRLENPEECAADSSTCEFSLASVDYAALADGTPASACGGSGTASDFDTSPDGVVVERELADGSAEVTVVLHTSHALAWAARYVGDPSGLDFASAPLLFGNRLCDVLGGSAAALVDSQLQLVFRNPAPGAPLPDLMELFVARFTDIVSISFRARGEGTLRAAFGVEDGTPGRLTVSQTGTLFRTNFGGATGDGFPAELINLRVVGH